MPLLQADLAERSFKGELSLLHVATGEVTLALPSHAHEGLQQFQPRVEFPEPVRAAKVTEEKMARAQRKKIIARVGCS